MIRTPKTIASRPLRIAQLRSLTTSTKPMMKPPSTAPVMLPMPPSTAAVKALRPALKPRLNWTMPEVQALDDAGGAGQRGAQEEGRARSSC